MRRLILVAILIAGCGQPPAEPTLSPEVRTIENTPITSIPVQPPPTLDQPAKTGAAPEGQDELSRKMNLPFAPAIAMDPVDGSKISIGPDTPVTEHKDRLYYFSSAKNRQAFLANPDAYLKEKLSTY